jgi:hypothetical protein
LLTDQGSVVVDYAFGQKQPLTQSQPQQQHPAPSQPHSTTASGPQPTPNDDDSTPAGPSPTTASDGPSTKVPFEKTIGPLTISNIGIHLKNDVIILLLDAEVHMGPFTFELLGCGIGFNLAKADFRRFNAAAIELELSGVALSWADPPVEIAALFEVVGPDEYVGGVTMTMEPYAFIAFGAYDGSVTIAGYSPFKSIFMFTELYGPLVELEFAEIQGVKLGFGYNSQLTLPGPADVPSFPLITGINGTDPVAVLTTLCQPDGQGKTWVAPKSGPMWLAAGLDVTAFDVVQVTAIVIFEFNPLILSILAIAWAQMPKPNDEVSPSTTAPADAFIYVELGIVSNLDFQKGTLTVLG